MHGNDDFELSFWDWVVFTTPDPTNINWSLTPQIWSERHGKDANEIAFYTDLNLVIGAYFLIGASGTFDTWSALQIFNKAKYARMAVTNPLLAVPAAAILGADAYMSVMTKYAPHDHHEQPSYWMAIAQAIGAGGVGVGTGTKEYV